jgi:hypothetical protein
MAKKVFCYEIPIELGDHVIYLVLANGQKLADSYIKKNFSIIVNHEESDEEAGAYFVGHAHQLFIYFPPGLGLEYLVHELVHLYKYMMKRMGTVQDEEGEAYIKQLIFKKMLDKLIETGHISVVYSN